MERTIEEAALVDAAEKRDQAAKEVDDALFKLWNGGARYCLDLAATKLRNSELESANAALLLEKAANARQGATL